MFSSHKFRFCVGKVEGRRKAGVWDGITRELWAAEEGGGLRRFDALMMNWDGGDISRFGWW